MSIKLKIESHLKFKQDIILSFQHLKQWNCLEALKKKTKNKNGENVPHLEIAEIVLVYCNVANNDYQQNLLVLYTFVPNKSFGSLSEISSTNFIF